MNTDWYESFITTARCRSLSKAAHELNLTQPALTKHIRHLEAHYETKLLERSYQGVKLTESGQLLLQRIQPVLSELRRIKEEFTPIPDRPLKLGTLPSVASNLLPAMVIELTSQGVELQVFVQNTSEELIQGMNQREMDAAILEEHCLPQGIWSRPVLSEGFVAIFPERHPISRLETITLADIAKEPLVLYPSSCANRQRLVEALLTQGLLPHIHTEVDYGEFIFRYVAAGEGITVMPAMITEHLPLDLAYAPIVDFTCQRQLRLAAINSAIGERLYRPWAYDKKTSPMR